MRRMHMIRKTRLKLLNPPHGGHMTLTPKK